ncbi:MAG TPA: Nramp family divalent metal transporter [Gaiellaceae bacterium]|nr:Nramp family divalent metal transporter [Gaiellaceae bacterium]
MTKVFQIALGILAAIGGFVDIGDIVFNATAGATFGYQLIWAVVVGALGIMVYSEMCGRVATVAKRPVFDVVRERLGYKVGVTTLCASQFVNAMTCAAEVGGLAIVLRYLFGLPYRPLIVLAVLILLLSVWALPFEWIERIFGFGGLLLIVFAVAALKLDPNWGALGHGFVPHIDTPSPVIWAYFVIGLLGATFMPYEVYFYSSGGVEDGWVPPHDLKLNKLTAIVGYGLGAVLSISIMVVAAELFVPKGIEPGFLGTVALAAQTPVGEAGLLLAILGMFFAISGAAIDTALAGAYNMAQFFGWEWGKYRKPSGAPRFTLTWIGFFLLAFLVVITGVDPIFVTELSVIFSVVALPLTYVPILLVAGDSSYMGEHANGRLASTLGWFYLVVIAIVSVAAVPLLVLTNMGEG